MPTLHPLASHIATTSLAAFHHRQLCQLCGLNPDLNQPQGFELSPELTSHLDDEFFPSSLTLELLETRDWRINSQLALGWEIVRLNDEVIALLAGANGQRGPAPFAIEDHPVTLDEDADLDWLADWPQIQRLFVPHSITDLNFLRHLPEIEKLTLADISLIDDFTPLNHPPFLGEVTVGNGIHPELAAGRSLLEKFRAQVINVPVVNFDLWSD